MEVIPFPRYSKFFGQQNESFEKGFNDRNQEPYGWKKVTRILNFPTDSELSQLKQYNWTLLMGSLPLTK